MNILDEYSKTPEVANLGKIVRRNLQSSLHASTFSNHTVSYPEEIVKALAKIYKEYNEAFFPLVEKNREWPTDYRYCFPFGKSINWAVQIDMRGLPRAFLEDISKFSQEELEKIIKGSIFEIDNSIAIYQLLERFNLNGVGINFRSVLNDLRSLFGKPIALLAVTEQKKESMLASEFGKLPGESITDAEVMELSGFDTFFGPSEFREYLMNNHNKCDYLLFVRSSDPVCKLKKPEIEVEHPLLSDPEMRQIIKANSITLNIDAPDMEYSKKINDTKEYMVSMGMAYEINSFEDLFTEGCKNFLESKGLNYEAFIKKEVAIRCKPFKSTYGCYGHLHGKLDRKFKYEFKKNLFLRGSYLLQPEILTPSIISEENKEEYLYIDRLFFGVNKKGDIYFLGGIRNFMPKGTTEAREHRIHANNAAILNKIIAA